MADENYARLMPGGLGLAALIPKLSGRGGKRPGAGRPKGSGANPKPAPERKTCVCGSPVGAGRSLYCGPCGAKKQAAKRRTCDHPKPVFESGKERKVCFDCAPPPAPKARKAYTPRTKRQATCSCCGATFVAGLMRHKFCSRACHVRASNRSKVEQGRDTDRKRARKYGCFYEPVNPAAVCERDGWTCYLCGVETPKELRGKRAANAPEVDHVIPLSKQGPHSYANVRCCCRRCNRAKGAKLLA